MKKIIILSFVFFIFSLFFYCDLANEQAQDDAGQLSSIESVHKDTRAPKSIVTLYSNTKYKGTKVKINKPGSYDIEYLKAKKIGDNNVSSIKIKKGYAAILFDGPNFDGDSITVKKNQKKFGSFDNKTSSLIVKKDGPDDDDDDDNNDDDDDNNDDNNDDDIRIAISADGNSEASGREDWFSVPVMYFLMQKAEKVTGKAALFKHLDYNSDLCGNVYSYAKEMQDSAVRGADMFGMNKDVLFNVQTRTGIRMAVENLAGAINQSSFDNRLHIVVAAPLEIIWRGIMKSDPSKREFVSVYSNNKWLDKYTCSASPHNMNDILKTGVKVVRLMPQGGSPDWTWVCDIKMKEFAFLCQKLKKVGKKSSFNEIDLCYYIITGDRYPSKAKYMKFLQ